MSYIIIRRETGKVMGYATDQRRAAEVLRRLEVRYGIGLFIARKQGATLGEVVLAVGPL